MLTDYSSALALWTTLSPTLRIEGHMPALGPSSFFQSFDLSLFSVVVVVVVVGMNVRRI